MKKRVRQAIGKLQQIRYLLVEIMSNLAYAAA
jgi:hypothetical protein